MTKPYAIYLRQSMDRTGNGLAVERQLEGCRQLAARLGLAGEPVVYVDNDVSATNTQRNRPEYGRLVDGIRAGSHDVLVVWHTDRLHRRPKEFEEFIELVERTGVTIHAVEANMMDLSTPTGRCIARIACAIARQEVEHKGARRRAAAIQAANLGKRPGQRIFGFGQTVIDEAGRRRSTHRHEVNEAEAALIRDAFARVAVGERTLPIWTEWNAKGVTTVEGRPWNTSNFGYLLRRKSVAGIPTYKKREVEGVAAAFPAIVDRQLFDAVQTIINHPSRRRQPRTAIRGMCEGVALCAACGMPMRARWNTATSHGTRRHFMVYTCPRKAAGHSTMSMRKLDRAVSDVVIDAIRHAPQVDPAAHDAVTAAVRALDDTRRARASVDALQRAGVLDNRAAANKRNALTRREANQLAELEEQRAADIFVGTDRTTGEALRNFLDAVKSPRPQEFDDQHPRMTDQARAMAWDRTLAGQFMDLPVLTRRSLVGKTLLIAVRPYSVQPRLMIADVAQPIGR